MGDMRDQRRAGGGKHICVNLVTIVGQERSAVAQPTSPFPSLCSRPVEISSTLGAVRRRPQGSGIDNRALGKHNIRGRNLGNPQASAAPLLLVLGTFSLFVRVFSFFAATEKPVKSSSRPLVPARSRSSRRATRRYPRDSGERRGGGGGLSETRGGPPGRSVSLFYMKSVPPRGRHS
jgi:hypothetical protein